MSTNVLNKIRGKSIAVLMLVLLLVVGFASIQVNAARVVKSVIAYQQEQSNWCWAALGKSIIQFHNSSSPSQSAIVTDLFGSAINNGASMSQQKTSLSHWGIVSSVQSNPLTYAGVQSQINNDHLINAGLVFQYGGKWYGHMNLIRGYDDSYSAILFIDPADGDYHGQNYNDFSDGVHYNGVHYYWNESLFDTN